MQSIRERFNLDDITHGIGLFSHPDDGLVLIDLDKCRDKDTGALSEWAEEIVRRFSRGLWEISPSGKGLHCICLGTAVEQQRYEPGLRIEIYGACADGHCPQFLTMPGNPLKPYPATLRNCDDDLRWLHEEYIEPNRKQKRLGKQTAKRDPEDCRYGHLSIDEIRRALESLKSQDLCNCHDRSGEHSEFEHAIPWLNVGCSLHHYGWVNNCSQEMLEVWIDWSGFLDGFDAHEHYERWDRFRDEHTIDSLFWLARNRYGYIIPTNAAEDFQDVSIEGYSND